MFFVLSKVLAWPMTPVGLSVTLSIVALVYLLWKKNVKRAMFFFYCGAAVLFIFSLPLTSNILMRGLEKQYLPKENYEQTSAVVFLGGASVGKIPPRIHVETNNNADRFFHAVRVFKQSYAAKMVLTGGTAPSFMARDTVPEAYGMFELLNEVFGIDTADVIIESESLNTRENAVYTKMALEQAGLGTDIVLVTNAYHMPRSMGIFKKAGFERVIPAPTGYFEDEELKFKPFTMLPNVESLQISTMAIKEYVGIVVYTVMGWI